MPTSKKPTKISKANKTSKPNAPQSVTASQLPKVKGVVRVRAVPGTNALVQNKVYELHPDHAAKMINRGVAQLV